MATPIDPANVVDFDQPLNTTPDYSSSHVFSTADVTGTFSGVTQGDIAPGDTPIIDFTATPKVTNDGLDLYPINSEFGFNVTDFIGAEQKDFEDDPEYAEGWAGDLLGAGGEQIGLVISDAPTDTFKTPALLGTWLAGLGGNTVKASTEHYVVMQHILSDQKHPEDPGALYPLDDNLKIIGGEYDGQFVADVLPIVGDANEDGVVDLKDVLKPNETEIDKNIAVSTDYSVTLKDDGKLLYRWGNTIKKPNDVRIEAELELPDEWKEDGATDPDLKPLFKVTAAELVVHHTITNNPNDQIRPEDYENESAIGTLPTYTILPDGKWVTTDDYYAGDGTLYPAGTVLKDPDLVTNSQGTTLDEIGALSSDLTEGFTNAWYTTMDREPFEPELDATGTEYVTGPRWRLLPDKYGQDLPSVVIPSDPSLPPPPTKDQAKYEVGAETQTVINLLDWANPISPLSISAGWLNESGTVTENGLNKTDNFDVAFYIKGDIKPATIYSTELVMDYEEVTIFGASEAITGGDGSDYLVGQGDNSFAGGAGEDLFVLSYGVTDDWTKITNSTVTDFSVTDDTLGLIGLDINETNFADVVSQEIVGGDMQVKVGGLNIATLTGVTEKLDIGNFTMLTPEVGDDAYMGGTSGDDYLVGDLLENFIVGFEGDDTLLGLEGDDALAGEEGDDALYGGTGNDELYGVEGDDTLDGQDGDDMLYAGIGDDFVLGGDGDDLLNGEWGDDVLSGESGNDTMNGHENEDWIYGGIGDDQIDGGAGLDNLYGGAGNDFMLGGSEADVMVGEWGNDALSGGDGNDTMNGNQDDDWLFAGLGDDVMDGGSGVDNLYGSLGNDTMSGGEGNDVMVGEQGNDEQTGGLGSDVFIFADGFQADRVLDFDATDDLEQINLAAVTSITDFADLQANHMTQVGSDVVIDALAGDVLTLVGVNLADLADGNDFAFV